MIQTGFAATLNLIYVIFQPSMQGLCWELLNHILSSQGKTTPVKCLWRFCKFFYKTHELQIALITTHFVLNNESTGGVILNDQIL